MGDLRAFVGSLIDMMANIMVVLGIGGVVVFGGLFVVGLVTVTLKAAWYFVADRMGTDSE